MPNFGVQRGSAKIEASPTFAFLNDKREQLCHMKDMHIFERVVNGRRYRIAAQSVWDPIRGRSVARQTVLGPETTAPVADLGASPQLCRR